MTNTTIYLAKITKGRDYASDITVACKAFSTLEKAAEFMDSQDMVQAGYGFWEKVDSFDYSGEITWLEVE